MRYTHECSLTYFYPPFNKEFALLTAVCYGNYSVHFETQYFLTPVSPVEGTETGLTGVRKKKKMGSKVNAMQKNRKGFAPFPENS